MQVNWNVFKFIITQPRQMIKATASTVRGRQLSISVCSFARNLDIACDKLTAVGPGPGLGPRSGAVGPMEGWQDDTLLSLTARTMFNAIFNTVFGRDDDAHFNPHLAYQNFQARD